MRKDTIILNKLKAALKLFLTASQYKALIDEDFEKLQEFLAEKGLYISDEGPRPKTSYISFNQFVDSIGEIGKKYISDFDEVCHVSGKVEFGSRKGEYKLALTVYDTKGKWTRIFDYEGPFNPKQVLEAFEDKLKGIEEVVGIDLPEEKPSENKEE